jgi:two-component system, cell cycle sensor histidine kinase and response regulator CckA
VPGEPELGAPATAVGGGETVLFVEDEAQVREIGARSLRGFGYTVLPARSGKEAIALAAAYPGAIHLLVSDAVLPDVRGPELAAAFRRARAAMPVLYSSGHMAEAIAQHGALDPGVSFLEKPYTTTQLAQAVRRALDPVGPPYRSAVPGEPAAAAEWQP